MASQRKSPSERKPRQQARRRTRVEIVSDRESRWWLFLDAGYSLFTLCGHCREQKHCRGKTRERVSCKSCYIDRGLPSDKAFNENLGR